MAETKTNVGGVQDSADTPDNKGVNKTPIDTSNQDNIHGVEHRQVIAERDRLKVENERLKKKLNLTDAPKSIAGRFTVGKQKYGFKDGIRFIRVAGLGTVSTEGLIAIANGEKPSKELIGENPILDNLEPKSAAEILENLVEIGFGYLQLSDSKK